MSSNLIDRTTDWGIAKLVKASDSESDMRRFESYYPCHTFESPVGPFPIDNSVKFSRSWRNW